jgi:hypothetical protein
MVPLETIVLQTAFQDSLEETIAELVAFLPRLFGALLILVVGWFVGRLLFRAVADISDRVELDKAVVKTPLGRMLGGTEQAVSRSFGRVSAWFVYALAFLAAADVLAVELLSEWITTAVSYLPSFIAGALIIIVGFVLADFLADAIGRTETVTETRYTAWFADGARIFLYFIALVIGLDTMGVAVDILFTFAESISIGLAVGIAIALGLAFGWGGKDYVAENIGGWVGSGQSPVPAGRTDGGADEQTDGGTDE